MPATALPPSRGRAPLRPQSELPCPRAQPSRPSCAGPAIARSAPPLLLDTLPESHHEYRPPTVSRARHADGQTTGQEPASAHLPRCPAPANLTPRADAAQPIAGDPLTCTWPGFAAAVTGAPPFAASATGPDTLPRTSRDGGSLPLLSGTRGSAAPHTPVGRARPCHTPNQSLRPLPTAVVLF